MARDPKIEVAAINIRIPSTSNRNYGALIDKIATLKKGVKVYGESYCAITSFHRGSGLGVVSKYTEIDIDGDWFDLDDFGVASPEKTDEIKIPGNLKPNHAAFYFFLNEGMHTIVFETYSEQKGLSASSFEKYLKEIVKSEDVRSEYGNVEVDIIKDYSAVDSILALPDLKELKIVIRRPNPDDIGTDLANIIESRLSDQGGDEYQEVLRARGKNSLTPNERTKSLAGVAADNGQVHARSLVNGVVQSQDTVKTPLVEATTYKPEESGRGTFHALAEKLLQRISVHRAR